MNLKKLKNCPKCNAPVCMCESIMKESSMPKMELKELIEKQIKEFEGLMKLPLPRIVEDFFRQSLQEIAEKSIEAVRVEERYKDMYSVGFNKAISLQQEKANKYLKSLDKKGLIV